MREMVRVVLFEDYSAVCNIFVHLNTADLERKIAAIADVESTTSTSSIQDSKV